MTLQSFSFQGEVEGAAVDSLGFRQALSRFATGVAVVATRTPEGKLEGLTANSFAAVSLEPPLVLWSLRRSAPSLDGFVRSGVFTVNVLSAGQYELSRHFARPSVEKFAEVPYRSGHGGCPILSGALATFECRLQSTADGGDHLIFIGHVLKASYGDGEPLIFSGGRYCCSAALPETS